jgi:hypothetical protein
LGQTIHFIYNGSLWQIVGISSHADLIEKTPVAGSGIANPSSGNFVLFIDSENDNKLSIKNSSGDIYVILNDGEMLDSTVYAKEFVNVNSGTITRDIDGEIETVAITDGRTLTISRNIDGTIDTVSDGTRTWTFTYTDGLLTSWSVEEI